jgi:16S rRNA (guanine966-N2)-methyltransferase
VPTYAARVRVVAGRFKGRTLHAPRGRGTRPTSDKVREAIFSVLGDVDDMRVLDLYAGSGALGIEALSRGAKDAAMFVEQDPAAVTVIRRNLKELGLAGPGDGPVVVTRDAIDFLVAFARRLRGGPFDLVFIDPPYSSAPRLGERLSKLLPAVLSEDARIVTEQDKRSPLELDLPLEFERDYRHTRIRIHRG